MSHSSTSRSGSIQDVDISTEKHVSTTHESRSGLHQRQPQPNENEQNRPVSAPSSAEKQHHWNDQDPSSTESTGVTQGHSSPQQPKHGKGASGSSSTGLPEGEDSRNPSSDHNPRTQAAHSGDAHGRDVTNQSHNSNTSSR